MDEIAEFSRSVLDALREPLEERSITISRAGGAATYPARFVLVAAMNPCPCGFWGDAERECTCLPDQIERYRGRLSGPLLDRIDLRVHVPRVPFDRLRDDGRERSSDVRDRILAARERMRVRLSGTGRRVNADLTVSEVKRFCAVESETERLLAEAVGGATLVRARLPPCPPGREDSGRSRGERSGTRRGRWARAAPALRPVIGIGPADQRYPPRLLDLRSSPDPLWVVGDPAALSGRAVSIVGTRRMTPYGARVARELAGACAHGGIVVVSGLAQGVDSAAHEGALDARGRTVAVLGAGIDAYLEEARGRRRRLAHAIRASGALVSEFPPNAPAQKWTFAQRDATIAALGEMVVVVEAPIDSGALITADEARRLRRPVYAVPGPIGAAASAGTNALIASGRAHVLTGAEMLLTAVGPSSAPRATDADDADARILDALAASPADPDALARRLGVQTEQLTPVIARLIVRGRIGASGDGRLVRR